jgi:hypothetical protein
MIERKGIGFVVGNDLNLIGARLYSINLVQRD